MTQAAIEIRIPDAWLDYALANQFVVFGIPVLVIGIICGIGFYRAGGSHDPFKKGSQDQGVPSSVWFPWLLILCGGGLALYFFAFFDTSVAVPGAAILGLDRVNNLGLMSQRQNGVTIGVGSAILGSVLLLVFKRR